MAKHTPKYTKDRIDALVKGPGAVMWVPAIKAEFILARVAWLEGDNKTYMKWVAINPTNGGNIHYTRYHKLKSDMHYNFLMDRKDDLIAEVSTVAEAPFTEASVISKKIAEWRHVLTLHNNQRDFDEWFENE
ncbi:hypothetical protein OAF83_03045 [Rubripirellula sp.]|jgi:hypothetical protein|nr:hypothetical protein [Rubripirellula sp.]MDB4749863.1 hypothetical protein [Rubripirellula sp.]